MAINDVKLDSDDLILGFNCALGVDLTPANALLTAHLMEKAGSDAARNTGTAKALYKRQRPYLIRYTGIPIPPLTVHTKE